MAVKVKICGLTNIEDAQVAIEAGSDFLGFIVATESPRYIAPESLAALLAKLTLPPQLRTVGVFVNTPSVEILRILDDTGLHFAQLHGEEPAHALAMLAGRGYKMLCPANEAEAQTATAYTAYPDPDAPQLMLDARDLHARGGTGKLADWQVASTLAKRIERFMLAGGLTPENVQSAVLTVGPWAVDVSSGVEASRGRKDHAKVRAFIKNAKAIP
jgi:phosphoribosylanthranilate isomerase